ncbi:MAG: hypothetical protein COS82_04505 [Zetaproteobacteria bacterium CG06_land_8_20_14_3_00_59_53]|nr:MAG: hypothetical protein AUK36_07225 [Zetaproteobacteria bacterium CG2_30_59_37]PIO88889.1 MAG: hypothetical protein COX56_10610 [Zetaproteobacteria bacterium CG23_combo_of_CG06-09_8_20_14_all_59_86]PIQ65193.1 MAG: hypothetical protein COV97_05190 [Zetaproteobacteria bacterium CG11_big_fil_rev_8_21_14_0_20_59_439]PIU70772.1 MAG: hypothetical protein COS82_04505 [Zetaproteobacteria bacterium CG06_land_8_20_14_3_00_59_53]PIU96442.1 MAG: hypothetical protein COS62_08840 [Zetaproteobacteria bac
MLKRIVYIAAHIEPVHTGGEQYNLHLIRAAEKAGVEVVRKVLTDSAIYQWLSDTRFLWRLCRAFIAFWLFRQLLRYRRETLLLDAWFAPLSWPGILLVRGRYLVMVHHLCSGLFSGWQRKWQAFCETVLLRGATRILTVSQSSRRQVEERTQGVTSIDVINTAFEPVEGISRGGGDVFRILFVGHVTRAKGVIDLAGAVAGLPGGGNWRLDIVGRNTVEPETTEQISSICRNAGVAERVTLHGRLEDKALLELYLSSDVFVLPSYWEGYGIVLLEAMSHRLAVVSTTAGAIPEVVADGETGLLVAPGDAVALRESILKLMRDNKLHDRLAENGLAFARRHPDWNDMEASCVAWWRELDEDALRS